MATAGGREAGGAVREAISGGGGGIHPVMNDFSILFFERAGREERLARAVSARGPPRRNAREDAGSASPRTFVAMANPRSGSDAIAREPRHDLERDSPRGSIEKCEPRGGTARSRLGARRAIVARARTHRGILLEVPRARAWDETRHDASWGFLDREW
jgi:hypothetical protein